MNSIISRNNWLAISLLRHTLSVIAHPVPSHILPFHPLHSIQCCSNTKSSYIRPICRTIKIRIQLNPTHSPRHVIQRHLSQNSDATSTYVQYLHPTINVYYTIKVLSIQVCDTILSAGYQIQLYLTYLLQPTAFVVQSKPKSN
jgi:hypothetical protein